jgi:hypothetical protein
MRNPTRSSIFSALPPTAMAKSFALACRPVLMSCEHPVLTYTLLAQRSCTSPHASFLLLACISCSSWPILTIASTLTQHQPVFCAPAAPRRPLPPAVLFHIRLSHHESVPRLFFVPTRLRQPVSPRPVLRFAWLRSSATALHTGRLHPPPYICQPYICQPPVARPSHCRRFFLPDFPDHPALHC